MAGKLQERLADAGHFLEIDRAPLLCYSSFRRCRKPVWVASVMPSRRVADRD
jgi:hypothetical protein